MKLKPYPEYKDSGVDWIGEIPEEWKLHKINQIFDIIGSGTTPNSQEEGYYENGVIPWVITGDLNDSILNETSKRISREAFRDHSTLKLYEKNSLIIAMYGATIGKISLLNLEACVNQACCVLSNSKILNHKFTFYWFLANKSNIISLSYGGGQPNISQDTIKSLRIQVPTILEQERIISFLDKKTSKIDLTIEKDTRLIELLKEKRNALINHVVTKGLDSTVKMKDSGVKWIGEIPEHWITGLLKRFNDVTDGSHFSPETVEDGKYYITVRDLKEKEIEFKNAKTISEADFQSLKRNGCQPKVGDIILSKDGTIGKCIVVANNDFVALSSLGIITPKEILNPHYLRYYIISDVNINQMFSFIRGSALTRLTINIINNLTIIVPPYEQQNKIVSFLDIEVSKINDIIQKIQKNIELLKEYKKSLIHHVVTGKVNVREVEV